VRTDEGKLWSHFTEPPPRVSARVPTLGTRFDPVVARAMDKHPDRRFQHAGEVGDAMTAAVATGTRGVRRRVPRPAGRLRRGALVAALTEPFNVVVLGALLVVGAVLGTVALMVPLALVVYAVAVAYSYRKRDG
jgi:serine/threonine-protein kinase